MLVLKGHTAPIWSLEYSPDGSLLASRDQAGRGLIWVPGNDRPQTSVGGDANAEGGPNAHHTDFYLEALAFVGEQRLLTADSTGQLRFWDLKANTLTGSPAPPGRVHRLSASPDGRFVALAREIANDSRLSGEGRVSLGNLSGNRVSRTSWGCQETVFCLQFSHRSDLLACGVGAWGRTGAARLYQIGKSLSVWLWRWNSSKHTQLRGPTSPVLSLAFSADDQLLAAGCSDGSVRVWRVADRQEVAHLRKHDDLVRGVAFAADGRTLISVGWDGRVKVWDVPTGGEKATFEWHTGMIHAIAFAPDGMTAATGGQDGNVVIWDVDFA